MNVKKGFEKTIDLNIFVTKSYESLVPMFPQS